MARGMAGRILRMDEGRETAEWKDDGRREGTAGGIFRIDGGGGQKDEKEEREF
jgi:hypothetical protein